ncbi:MAG: FecR family protein [Bacillota bacterium]|nr:FecR family protein [Bacillota bacterium]
MVQLSVGLQVRQGTRALFLFLVLAVLCVWVGRGLLGGARAQAIAAEAVATVAKVEGRCVLLPARSEKWADIEVGRLICRGDRIRCGPDSWAVLGLADGGSITLGPGCEVRFDSLLYLRLFIGRLWAKVKSAASGAAGFSVETPSAVVGVRGTHFSVCVSDESATTVSVASGVVEVFGAGEAVLVPQGYATRVRRGHAPAEPEPMGDDEKRVWAEEQGRFANGDSDDGDENDNGDDDEKGGKQDPGAGNPPDHDGGHVGGPPGDAKPGDNPEDDCADVDDDGDDCCRGPWSPVVGR